MSTSAAPAQQDLAAGPLPGAGAASLFVLAVALVLRLFHVLAIFRSSPFFDVLPGDLGAYDRWAQSIVQEGWLGKEIFYQDPLYPYFLAAIYSVLGRSLVAVYLIQSLLGAATASLLVPLGDRLGSRAAGLTAGLTYAAFAPAIFFDGLLLKSSLASFLVTACLAMLLARSPGRPCWRQLAAGALLGLACLTRGNFLLLLPVLAGLLALGRRTGLGGRLAASTLFVAGSLAVLLPVMARNYVVGHDLVLTTAQAGQNFFIGQNERATGTYVGLPFVRPDPLYERQDFHREAERRLGRALSPSEVSRYWLEEGLRFIRENPKRFAALSWRKVQLYFNFYEIADNHNFYFHRRYSPVLAFSPVTFALVGPFWLWGLAVLIRSRTRPALLMAATQLAYGLTLVAFYIFDRYRAPMAPLACLAAGIGLADLVAVARQRRWPRLAGQLALVGLAAVFVNHTVIPAFDFSHSLVDQGIAFEMKGQPEKALASYQEALAVQPLYARAWERRGRLELGLGRLDEARASLRRALELDPRGAQEARRSLWHLEQRLPRREQQESQGGSESR
ncbi:MAG: tetratricopeptide repeat protein [Thermodesulfobacteriota bacterium]